MFSFTTRNVLQAGSWLPSKAESKSPVAKKQKRSLAAAFPFLLLILLQILDGGLTFQGLNSYGVEMEGNALLRSFMVDFGVVGTLAFAKGLAISAVLFLWFASTHVSWARKSAFILSIFYICSAIGPWSVLLLSV